MLEGIEPKFVEYIPDQLDLGVLYISIEFATASHLCCCGCGEKVVTPFTPTDWRMTYDGTSVSLRPSVGNWEQDCQTHYVIDRNAVIECAPWTREEIEQERARDQWAKAEFYRRSVVRPASAPPVVVPPSRATKLRFLQKLKNLFVRGE